MNPYELIGIRHIQEAWPRNHLNVMNKRSVYARATPQATPQDTHQLNGEACIKFGSSRDHVEPQLDSFAEFLGVPAQYLFEVINNITSLSCLQNHQLKVMSKENTK